VTQGKFANSFKSKNLSRLDALGCDPKSSLPIDFCFANSFFQLPFWQVRPNPNVGVEDALRSGFKTAANHHAERDEYTGCGQ
jgi:hypothetical protein